MKYIKCSDNEIYRTLRVHGVVLDFDCDNKIVGVELLEDCHPVIENERTVKQEEPTTGEGACCSCSNWEAVPVTFRKADFELSPDCTIHNILQGFCDRCGERLIIDGRSLKILNLYKRAETTSTSPLEVSPRLTILIP